MKAYAGGQNTIQGEHCRRTAVVSRYLYKITPKNAPEQYSTIQYNLLKAAKNVHARNRSVNVTVVSTN